MAPVVLEVLVVLVALHHQVGHPVLVLLENLVDLVDLVPLVLLCHQQHQADHHYLLDQLTQAGQVVLVSLLVHLVLVVPLHHPSLIVNIKKKFICMKS